MAVTSPRIDAIYFLAFAAVVFFAIWLSSRSGDEIDSASLPDFSLPGVTLDADWELPLDLSGRFAAPFIRFGRPATPQLELSENMESVMVEVREALLESSAPVEVATHEEPRFGPHGVDR